MTTANVGPMAESAPRVIIIGSSFRFPYGQGAATRAYMYAKALRHAGAEVRVVSLITPARDDDGQAEAASGTYDGIAYEYACGTRVRPGSFMGRRLLRVRRFLRVCDLVRGMARGTHGPTAVLIYSSAWFWVQALTVLAHGSGAVAVLDLCEYPRPRRHRGARATLWRAATRLLLIPALDGIVPISTYLQQYVAAGPRPPETLLVPVMVDTDLFAPPPADPETVGRNIVFCGALGRYEEVARAVTSFAEAARDVPKAKLLLVGYGPPAPVARAKALVRELGLEDTVTFTGDVRREDLPGLFAGAEVFVLPRPPGVIAAAGLPNKLGEYLAAAHPVVVNANGDVSRYLVDGVSAYLVDPGDEAAFTARLRFVLEHRDDALEVGARGRTVAVGEFDYRRHGVRLAEFIAKLTARRVTKDRT